MLRGDALLTDEIKNFFSNDPGFTTAGTRQYQQGCTHMFDGGKLGGIQSCGSGMHGRYLTGIRTSAIDLSDGYNIAMKVDHDSGLLQGAVYHPSPNCDDRPDPEDLSLIVIHNISLPPGEFGGGYIDALFTNSLQPDAHPYFREIHQLQVSAHLLIRRDGGLIQYVPFHKRAWHAGESCYEGRVCCNDYSIGIELEGTDELPYTDEQYTVLQQAVSSLLNAYPRLEQSRIAGHCDIAPERKTDPGPAFDWNRFASALV